MKKIEKMEEDGTFEVLPKKEVVQLNKEHERLREIPRWYPRYEITSRRNVRC